MRFVTNVFVTIKNVFGPWLQQARLEDETVPQDIDDPVAYR